MYDSSTATTTSTMINRIGSIGSMDNLPYAQQYLSLVVSIKTEIIGVSSFIPGYVFPLPPEALPDILGCLASWQTV